MPETVMIAVMAGYGGEKDETNNNETHICNASYVTAQNGESRAILRVAVK